MALCCFVKLDDCWNCKQPTLVHLERPDVYKTGWGCVTCKTAIEFKIKCPVKGCKEIVSRYAKDKKNLQSYEAECNSHYLKKIEKLFIEGKVVSKKKVKKNE